MRRKILVYSGVGAEFRSVLSGLAEADFDDAHISYVASDYLSDDQDLSDAAMLIMPGGADLPYCAALNGAGNAKIRAFVESGGMYLGICAGGYYGCAQIAFRKGYVDEILQKRELNFFKGTGVGPINDIGEAYNETKQWAMVLRLVLKDGSMVHCYYHGGSYFMPDNDDHDHEILARYVDFPGQPAAIVSMRVGLGKVILSGVHPEVSSAYLKDDLAIETTNYDHLVAKLDATDTVRARLWKELLS